MNLKKELLDLLERDEEFRYAVAGKLGLLEILRRLDAIEEELKEHTKILKQHSQILEQHSRILEEHTRILEQHTKILEEHTKRLEEHGRVLEELVKEVRSLGAEVRGLRTAVGSLGRRLGVDFESVVRSLVAELLAGLGVSGHRVERFRYRDDEGRYGPRGVVYEVDMYVGDGKLFLVELKSLAEEEDVDRFALVASAVEKILGRRADGWIIAAVHAAKEAVERARELGIHLVYGQEV